MDGINAECISFHMALNEGYIPAYVHYVQNTYVYISMYIHVHILYVSIMVHLNVWTTADVWWVVGYH